MKSEREIARPWGSFSAPTGQREKNRVVLLVSFASSVWASSLETALARKFPPIESMGAIQVRLDFAISLYCSRLNFFASRPSPISSFARGAAAFEAGEKRKAEECSSEFANGGTFRLPSTILAAKGVGASRVEGERGAKECDLARRSLRRGT